MPELTDERLRRWRLVLGGGPADGAGAALDGDDLRMDAALTALYDGERGAGLGSSAPNVARWLGDIRAYFPSSVVRVMQRDALERLSLKQMLLEPELLATLEPDVRLAATLLSLQSVLPGKTRETGGTARGRRSGAPAGRAAPPGRARQSQSRRPHPPAAPQRD